MVNPKHNKGNICVLIDMKICQLLLYNYLLYTYCHTTISIQQKSLKMLKEAKKDRTLFESSRRK